MSTKQGHTRGLNWIKIYIVLITGISHIAVAVKSFKEIDKWLNIIKNNNIKKFRSIDQGVNVISVKIDSFSY